MKATENEIKNAYAELGNIWKVADRFGMCGQSVYERLVRFGVDTSVNIFSDLDRAFLIANYASAISRRGGLQALANNMGRTKQFICRQARKLGLTDIKRAKHPDAIKSTAAGVKAHIKTNGHPKGMLGKTHTTAVREAMGVRFKAWFETATPERMQERSLKAAKTRVANGTFHPKRNASWKAGWREIGKRSNFYRSKWESNYARVLQWAKERGGIIEWEHEPDIFMFSAAKQAVSYLPDFKITNVNGEIEYHEVKGWMDDRSIAKLTAMQTYYPDVNVIVINSKIYADLKREFSQIIEGWEP